MKKDDGQLITVGKLLGELKKYEKKRWDDSVVAWVQDDHTLGVVGMGKDKDGNLRIEVEKVEEELEGIWTVADVVDSLERNDNDVKVYLAGHGLYFTIVSDGRIFTEVEDDDVIGCDAAVFGEYQDDTRRVPADKEIRRTARRSAWRARTKDWKSILEGITFLLCILLAVYGFYYNIAALVKHTRPVWECVLWLPFLALLIWVCIDNLFFPDRNE